MSKKNYELVTDDGRLRFSVPEEWKITFGPISIGAKGSYGTSPLALRVYESDTKQRAIFTNVRSFRDLSIPIQRLKVREKGSSEWQYDDGNRHFREDVELEREWVEDAE